MFMKRPRNRVFDYTPRFYTPESDEKERKKRRLGFSRQIKTKRKNTNSVIWIMLILIIIFAIIKLGGI